MLGIDLRFVSPIPRHHHSVALATDIAHRRHRGRITPLLMLSGIGTPDGAAKMLANYHATTMLTFDGLEFNKILETIGGQRPAKDTDFMLSSKAAGINIVSSCVYSSITDRLVLPRPDPRIVRYHIHCAISRH